MPNTPPNATPIPPSNAASAASARPPASLPVKPTRFPSDPVGLWQALRQLKPAPQASNRRDAPAAFAATSLIHASPSLAHGLSLLLSRQNLDARLSSDALAALFLAVYERFPEIVETAAQDLGAVCERDPAVTDPSIPFLYFKGFHALQTHRLAHSLWSQGAIDEALFLQNRSSVLYGVDIHPAARIGKRIMLDHATGIVVGETAVIEDDVSMLHSVTLGGTGKERGDRHPKIRQGVMLGAGATVLGNIEIGAGACVAAGSVVLQNVPPHTTVAGVPARVVGKLKMDLPSREMDQAASFGELPT